MLNRKLLVLSLLSLSYVLNPFPVLANVSNISITSESSLSLENQAQKLYENGEFQPAITNLKDAINNYQKQDNLTGQIIAWRNLGLVYQKMGNPQEAKQAVAESIKYLSKIADNKKRQELLAKTLEVQGQIQLSIGDSQASLDTWQQIIDIYEKSGDSIGLIRTKINESQSLQGLGLYNQAVKNLTATQAILDKQPDTLLKAKALLTLGDVLRGVRKLDESTQVLNQSLTVAKKLASNSTIITEVFISLGKTQRLKLNSEQAINYYQQAIEKSPTSDLLIQAYLNQFDLLLSDQKVPEVQVLIPKIQDILTKLPASRSAVYARITFAKTILKNKEIAKTYQNLIVKELATALNLAQKLADNRAESYTLGVLGNVYEKNHRYPEAQKLTEKAVLIAQRIKAPDISYKWQWQLGRILAAAGNQKDAIFAYQQTVKTLKNIRTDLVAISSDLQFSFREDVEPVYRELAGLLLHENSSQAELKEARQVIEDLQLAELDNFFRNACLNSKPVEIDELNDPTTAVFYTLILKDRLELIVALPNQPLQKYSQPISQVDLENGIKELKRELTNARGANKRRLRLSQQIYNWLINKELATKLEHSKIKNLVFISDGVFRNIPLAALYDGKQYLIEKYSIALAPSLQLVDIKPLLREQVQLFAAGISESREKFDALPNVILELAQIKAKFPNGILLKNESFTNSTLEKNIKQYPAQIVHLATHGQFSSKAEDTFILTWDSQLNIDQLTNILRSDKKQIRPIELLVLSACQTASGDKRASLGLAGIAVKAGVRSTVASLWSVDDQATSLLMTKFYQELANSKITKSEALRRAQLAILNQEEFKHPYFWSAFVLIGNWL
ncbi:CHAT domain-containing protein [Dolichospermum sp. UHCC 0259]|uniref:CHAT domain-containing protein n=1 Tax=Dolichospermum sp. UHCC 0259 TaxID=2590010 RepID=UPI0014489DE5|nr:CHAT domain-containing protein [Dolichospermum sp. UHCC 0259]MTJ51014.1 CHAT domain-containing protein [Dolichospermum sp. UHCC 0259]